MSEVILDTITGKSTATTITIGSTPVVSASANSMTIRGEGSNQTSIQQGLAKVWVNVTNDNFTLQDNFNASSMTDNAVGRPEVNFTNAMANITYAYSGGAYNRIIGSYSTDGELTTTSLAVALVDSGGNFSDIGSNKMGILVHGDLS